MNKFPFKGRILLTLLYKVTNSKTREDRIYILRHIMDMMDDIITLKDELRGLEFEFLYKLHII
jgi:hypothetical protein